MPSFLQQIIRNGTRPIPVAARARRQPPVIALEVDHVMEPDAPPKAPPREQASSPPPSHNSSTMRSEHVAENPASEETEVRLLQSRLRLPIQRQDGTASSSSSSPAPGAAPSNIEPPLAARVPLEPDATFLAPRPPPSQTASPPAIPTSAPTGTLPPAAGSESATQPSAERETIFRTHPRELPDARSPAERAHPQPTAKQDAGTEPEADARQREAVASWVESVPSPRTGVRQAIRPPSRSAHARTVERTTIGRASAAIPSAAEARPIRPDRTHAREASAHVSPSISARPATTTHEPRTREHSSAPAAADRLPRGTRLTVNHLNVQIVNEDRSSRKEPPKPRTPSPSREPWGTFERRHLRVL